MAIHERFDLASWIKKYPLEVRRRGPDVREWRNAIPDIHCPVHVAYNWQLQQRFIPDEDHPDRIPCDFMCWGVGEPKHPAASKLGGVPFLTSVSEWLVRDDGTPMTFIGQICFADSSDLVGDLPGDVLLIFCEKLWFAPRDPTKSVLYFAPDDPPESCDDCKFVWKQSRETNVIDATEFDPDLSPLPPKYAQLLRCQEYPGVDDFIEVDGDRIMAVNQWNGSKIGGLMSWPQGRGSSYLDIGEDSFFPGQLGTTNTTSNLEDPFVNLEKIVDESQVYPILRITEGGYMLFWMNMGKSIGWWYNV